MRILILHFVDTLAIGGLQHGLANLIEHMDATRFEHAVCAMRPVEEAQTERFSPGLARVMCFSKEEAGMRFQVPAAARIIRSVKPDVVHTRNWGTSEALLAARQAGACARLHSEHGMDCDTAEKEPRRRVWIRRLAFQLADRVLAVSQQLRELHARRTGFPERKITVVHNGVDTGRFAPDFSARARIRRELGLSDAEFCIGCVGNLIPVKDHLTLIEAAGRFAQCGKPWRLLIIGDGPEFPKLHAYVHAHAAWKDRVVFLGKSRSIPGLLNAMDVYVLSSLTEGISNSLLEAMATGLPVVATATGGNPEVIRDGDSGLLFPVGDAGRLAEHLLALDNQREWRLQLGERALRRVRDEFSIGTMARKYEAIYDGLVRVRATALHAAARG